MLEGYRGLSQSLLKSKAGGLQGGQGPRLSWGSGQQEYIQDSAPTAALCDPLCPHSDVVCVAQLATARGTGPSPEAGVGREVDATAVMTNTRDWVG